MSAATIFFAKWWGGDPVGFRFRLWTGKGTDGAEGHRSGTSQASTPLSGATNVPESFVDQDAELVAGIRAGTSAAFTELLQRHGNALRRFAYGLVHDVAVADDIVQDVFAAIWIGRSDWSPHHGARTYLFGAVRNRALNAAQHAMVRRRTATMLAESMIDAATHGAPPAPDIALDQRTAMAGLRVAFRALTERRRTALRLRYVEEMTVPEIARVMGTSVKAAEQLVWQALQALRRAAADGVPPE